MRWRCEWRQALTRTILAVALLASVALAETLPTTGAAPASLQPDVRLAGAEARLGLGGGFWSGAWSELRLTARARGEYRLRLEVQSGSIRSGFTPMQVRLEVPDAAGVREARVRVPLFSPRPVILNLSGPEGERRLRVEAFTGNPAIVASDRVGRVPSWRGERTLEVYGPSLPTDPALWISGPALIVTDARFAPSTGALLSMLAAGAHVVTQSALPILPSLEPGPIGLGALETKDSAFRYGTPGTLNRLMGGVVNALRAPEPRAPTLGWWAAGLFACGLVAFGVLRARPQGLGLLLPAVSAATLAATALGFWAWQPSVRVVRNETRVLIGAGGWGLTTTLTHHVQLHGGTVELPPSVVLRQPMPVTYTPQATVVETRPWSSIAYWAPPSATSVPLRVVAGRIINRSAVTLSEVYVVGAGIQEPIGKDESARIVSSETYPPTALEGLAMVLPKGSVIGRVATNAVIFIALPEVS